MMINPAYEQAKSFSGRRVAMKADLLRLKKQKSVNKETWKQRKKRQTACKHIEQNLKKIGKKRGRKIQAY